MPERIYNFFPGPCTLPLSALKQAEEEFLNYRDSGMSLWETSHRSEAYESIHNEAVSLMKEVFRVPDSHQVLMISGGGTLQFSMIPMNFLYDGRFAEHVNTGVWATRALEDARIVGDAREIASGKDSDFLSIPKDYPISPDAEYLYLTTNNTIVGSEFHVYPDTGDVPLILDMSSDILTREVDWSRIGLAFAGLTKNLGPGGMAVVIISKDLLKKANRNLTSYLRYDIHNEHNSMYNTPPMFCIYLMKLILEWTRENGGLDQMDKNADLRANMIYGVLDEYKDYYNCPVAREDRSRTNICWTMPTEELEKKFAADAAAKGMVGLEGYFLIGHNRASLYNAMPMEGAEALAKFMVKFMNENPA